MLSNCIHNLQTRGTPEMQTGQNISVIGVDAMGNGYVVIVIAISRFISAT